MRRCAAGLDTSPRRLVVEFGSRHVNGGVRDLFGLAAFVGVDIRDGPGVDVVADAADWTPDRPADVVVSTEVLEHTERAAELIVNAWRILRPGGTLIVTAAGPGRSPHSADDGGPISPGEWYRNIPAATLTRWLDGWENVTIDVHGFDIRAVARKPKGVS